MRPEKQFLVDEVNAHLDKSDYVFVTDYQRATVPISRTFVASLRKKKPNSMSSRTTFLKSRLKIADSQNWMTI